MHTAAAGRPKSRLWVWVIGLLAIALVVYLAYRRHDDPAQSARSDQSGRGGGPGGQGGGRGFTGPVALNVATAKQGDLGVYLNAIGTVTPVYTSTS